MYRIEVLSVGEEHRDYLSQHHRMYSNERIYEVHQMDLVEIHDGFAQRNDIIVYI
jgi:23S rRNA pseudoU1915 N3-methylase RlmH